MEDFISYKIASSIIVSDGIEVDSLESKIRDLRKKVYRLSTYFIRRKRLKLHNCSITINSELNAWFTADDYIYERHRYEISDRIDVYYNDSTKRIFRKRNNKIRRIYLIKRIELVKY